MDDDMFLYWGSGSPPCWRVMITMAEKGLKYGSKLLSFGAKEHKSEEVLKLNPRGQLPTFRHGDVVVNESIAICDYLQDRFPDQGTCMLPSDPKERAVVLQRKYEALNLHKKGIEDLAFYMFGSEKKQEVIDERLEAARKELGVWDGYVAKDGFAAGSKFSQADVVLFPSLAFLCRLGLSLNPKYPALENYYKSIVERPSVQASWPPHWKESEPKDILKDL